MVINNLEIYNITDSIFTEKENKTKVNYFIFDEYEIHLNIIPSYSSQEWHKHNLIEEAIFVISGELEVKWKEQNHIESRTVSENSIIRVKDSIHTIENQSNKETCFLVFRMVPDGINKRTTIKYDKQIIDKL